MNIKHQLLTYLDLRTLLFLSTTGLLGCTLGFAEGEIVWDCTELRY